MGDNPWERVTVWHELMSLDPERARKFYQEVIGFTTSPLEGSPFPYMVWMQDGEPVGGFVPPQGQQKGRPGAALGEFFCYRQCQQGCREGSETRRPGARPAHWYPSIWSCSSAERSGGRRLWHLLKA